MSLKNYSWLVVTFVVASIFISGCQLTLVDGEVVEMSSLTSISTADIEEPTPPSVELILGPASTEGEPTAAEIFDSISPAVAFVETASATGSGALIEHGYLLTNAHVVWPYNQVRVVFPDGSEHVDVPVHSWDLVADLALVGPIESEIEPVSLVDGSELEIGTDIYLIGYPAELEEFPTPSITNGILSRLRTWEAIDYTFFQVDATTVGGQSGGIMVTQQGDVVGISTFYFSGFGLASSVADALPRLNQMLAGSTGFALETRGFGGATSATSQSDMLDGEVDTRTYILDSEIDAEIELTVEGVGKPGIAVHTIDGEYIDAAAPREDEQLSELDVTIESEVPHIVTIFQPSTNENTFELTSSDGLIPYVDPDDGQVVEAGTTIVGSIDTGIDEDHFEIELKAGEKIKLTVDSIAIDPAIVLEFNSGTLSQVAVDDDSAGGIFGHNAELIYEAPEDETYEFTIVNVSYSGTGGYILTVEDADEDDQVTELEVDQELIASGFGPLVWYESETYDFAMLRPAEWEEAGDKCGSEEAVVCYTTGFAGLMILEGDLRGLPKPDRSREGYNQILTDMFEANPSATIVAMDEETTLQKLESSRFVIDVPANRTRLERFVFVDEEEQIAFNAVLFLPEHAYDMFLPMVDLVFRSFRYWQVDDRTEEAVYYHDEASKLISNDEYDDALEALNKAIELDPELEPAYHNRAWVYEHKQEFESAFADINKAVALEPEQADTVRSRAMLYYTTEAYDDALVDIDAAIALRPKEASFHNLRALINGLMGNYDDALADIDRFQELSNDELLAHAQDSRGFIYIRMGEFEKAKDDFDAIYDQDLRFPYALLGGGIAYAKLGMVDEGLALIEEAMDEFEEDDLETPEPQLKSLLEMAEEIRAVSK